MNNTIWTPNGAHALGTKTAKARIELKPGVMEWFRQFADVAASLNLGLHCARCGADVVGHNADSDRVFSATCGCREFLGMNRDVRSH